MSEFELSRLGNYSDDALIAELHRAAACVPERYLSRATFDRVAKCSSSVVQKRFGSWASALKAAGLAVRFSGGVGARGRVTKTFTDDDLLSELRAVAAHLDSTTCTVEAFQKHGRPNAETIRRRFGSWGKALRAAGLEISSLGRRHSEDDYFENLLAVWTHYGRQPKYGEMDKPPSRISSGAYEAKWGTWRLALIAFVQRTKQTGKQAPASQDSDGVAQKTTAAPPRARGRSRNRAPGEFRSVTIGLRYQVLHRDRFRCVLCGACPALRPDCELHVDHIVPVARGGKTVLANLRTLCFRCNLGKGSRMENVQ